MCRFDQKAPKDVAEREAPREEGGGVYQNVPNDQKALVFSADRKK
jgi:hypothetical protein